MSQSEAKACLSTNARAALYHAGVFPKKCMHTAHERLIGHMCACY